ncbi:MAG: DNA gyrase subunit A, partial [Burkholderiaceae bacterium]
DDPKAALMERFRLSAIQADDILEIRLRQLARLEAIKIEQELKDLRIEQGRLEEILASPAVLRRTLIKEIEQDARQHGDDRRTLIQAEQRAVAEVRIIDEPVTVVVSLKGWVRTLKGHEVDLGALGFKAGDGLYGIFPCRSVDALLVFGSEGKSSGRVYSTPVAGLPSGRGDGQPITSLIELEAGTQPAHYHAGAASQTLLLSHTGGFGLLARVVDLTARQRGGKAFLSLESGERPLPPSPVTHAADGAQVACLTLAGRLLVFGLDELKLQPAGGRGLTLIDLEAKDALVSVTAFAEVLRMVGSGRGGKPKDELLKGAALEIYRGKRARKGKAQKEMVKALRVQAG